MLKAMCVEPVSLPQTFPSTNGGRYRDIQHLCAPPLTLGNANCKMSMQRTVLRNMSPSTGVPSVCVVVNEFSLADNMWLSN